MYAEFLKEETGAQVIEYALIIATVSIGLVLALQPTALGGGFQNFINRLVICFTTGPCA